MIYIPPVVKQLLIAIIVLFVGTQLLAYRGIINLNEILSLHYFLSPNFQPWQIVSHMFMHSPVDFRHLLFNAIGLLTFGGFMERYIGSKKFLQLFVYSGIGAVVIDFAVDAVVVYNAIGEWFPSYTSLGIQIQGDTISTNNPIFTNKSFNEVSRVYLGSSLGASGALYGVMAALAFIFPNTEFNIYLIPVPIKAKILVPVFIAIDIYMALNRNPTDNIAHVAHIGGALSGFLFIYFTRKFDRKNFF